MRYSSGDDRDDLGHKLSEPYASFAAAAAIGDSRKMTSIACKILNANEITLPHPRHSWMSCCCRASYTEDFANVLFFSDEKRENRWCLIQSGDFFNHIVTDTEEILISKGASGPRNALLSKVKSGKLDRYWLKDDKFGGVLVSSSRPYHFFYDQLIKVEDIMSELPTSRRLVHFDDRAFFIPQNGGSCFRSCHVKEGHYYVLPSVIYSLGWKTKRPIEYYSWASRMEASILQDVRPGHSRLAELVVWIGVSAHKRSWIEQIEGYASIILHLREKFESVYVYIDGMTAPEGQSESFPEEVEVADRISAMVGKEASNCVIETVVGQSYREKIKKCYCADVFVCDSGTACMVPLRICKKPGVLHGNGMLDVFSRDTYPRDVTRVERKHISVSEDADRYPKAHVSYSIDWRVVSNRVDEVLDLAKLCGGHQK